METEFATPAPAILLDDRSFRFDHGMTAMPAMSDMPQEPEQHQPHDHHQTQTPIGMSPPPADNMQSAPWLDTPLHVTDHGVPSNLRDSHRQQEPPESQVQANPATITENTIHDSTALLDRKPSDAMIFAGSEEGNDDSVSAILQHSQAQLSLDQEVPSTPSHMDPTTAAASPEATTEEAYAMLKFNDSHCYVRTTNLVICRDMNFLAKYQQKKKMEKKRARARHAQHALSAYHREPSQPSLMGDDDPSGESLEGRPEPTGPVSVFSVFSEQGGAVAYNNPYSDDENDDHSRTRRRDRKHKSSSNTSVAPRSLMAFAEGENLQAENRYAADGTLNDPRLWAQLPVHPPIPADIKRISREHLLIHYDSHRGRWLLDVIGNGAIVNGIPYKKDTTDLELSHNDEIFIATLGMRFMLPESVVAYESESEYEGEDEEALADTHAGSGSSMSPARRLSNLFSADDSSSDDDDEPLAQIRAAAKPPVPKLKLKFKKAQPKEEPAPELEVVGGKGKGKGKGKALKNKDKSEKSERPEKAEKAEKKPEKKPAKVETKAKPKEESATEAPDVAKAAENVRKPSDAAREPVPTTVAGPNTEQSPAVPAPPIIDPTSVLANLAPDQLPEKRKGPGRPPKNGLLSKRDESGVKRKTKEFERQGMAVPSLDVLIHMVRQEQKAKDAANKAQALGQPIPDMPMPSIESADTIHDGDRGRPQTPRDHHTMESGSPGADRKLSPRMPRPMPREASPIKPMADFTEEELKKPNMTYIYIIDEVLQNVEGGKADLQAIYDKIMKRWPFYKYKVGSLGWQSSVRHNLLSCDRFRDAGKSGKGKLWAINHDHPLDNKKRKPTPPPRPMQMPMQNGQMPHANMGQNQYGQPYNGQYQQPASGQQPYAGKPGSASYYSPYGQPGNYPPAGANGQHAVRQGSNGAYPSNTSQTPQPPPQGQQPPAPANPFQPVVDAILSYRTQWLGTLAPNTPEYTDREAAFSRGTDYFSNLFHGSGGTTVTDAEVSSVEPFMSLKAIFEKHKHLFVKKPAEATSTAVEGNGATADAQAVQSEPVANGAAPVAQAAGPTPAPHAGPSTSSSQPPQPAQVAPGAPSQAPLVSVNGSAAQDQVHDVEMTGTTAPSAPPTAVAADGVQAAPSTLVQTSSSGAPTSLPSSSVTANTPPPDAPTTAPMSTPQPNHVGGNLAEPSVVANAPSAQTVSPTPQPSVSQQPALPAAPPVPSHPGAVIPATQPMAPPVPTAAAQQLPVEPPEAPIAANTSSPPTSLPEQTSVAAVQISPPSAGVKRPADDGLQGEEEMDTKRPKLT